MKTFLVDKIFDFCLIKQLVSGIGQASIIACEKFAGLLSAMSGVGWLVGWSVGLINHQPIGGLSGNTVL